MIYKPEDLKAQLDEAIQACIKGEGLVRLAWVLVKLVRHGRVRCRNNKALYNYLGKAYPELRFDEVPKTILSGPRKGQMYMGLTITNRATGVTIDEGDNDEGED
jgi:hypothetical protein